MVVRALAMGPIPPRQNSSGGVKCLADARNLPCGRLRVKQTEAKTRGASSWPGVCARCGAEGGTPTGCARPERGYGGTGPRSVVTSEYWTPGLTKQLLGRTILASGFWRQFVGMGLPLPVGRPPPPGSSRRGDDMAPGGNSAPPQAAAPAPGRRPPPGCGRGSAYLWCRRCGEASWPRRDEPGGGRDTPLEAEPDIAQAGIQPKHSAWRAGSLDTAPPPEQERKIAEDSVRLKHSLARPGTQCAMHQGSSEQQEEARGEDPAETARRRATGAARVASDTLGKSDA